MDLWADESDVSDCVLVEVKPVAAAYRDRRQLMKSGTLRNWEFEKEDIRTQIREGGASLAIMLYMFSVTKGVPLKCSCYAE